MPTIFIDNLPYTVSAGQNLLHACLSLGLNLPYFCWHPALGSVGACRQCAVVQFKDEQDKQGKIVMACMTPAIDGTRISIDNPQAAVFRASVIEWMMTNHPHDCPICDEGGECHLQDMTVMTGHAHRTFRFNKRTHRNQYLGPFINHEMNRCISCYRCLRFYNDYAMGTDFNVFGTRNNLYFGRQQEGVLESEFSGNLVEICPTGVFTDKSLKTHYTRKWDLQTAPSVCTHCGLGCNTIPGERYGTLRRIRNRYHSQINGYFLCDRGRYGYEFVNSEKRIQTPLARTDKSAPLQPVTGDDILRRLAPLFAGDQKVMGIGSPRASVEANFALRQLVGAQSFCNGMNQKESKAVAEIIRIYQNGTVSPAAIKEVENADAVLILGEDITNTAPRLDLAVKQALKNQPKKAAAKLHIEDWNAYAVQYVAQGDTGPLYIITPFATRLDRFATACRRAAPDDIARLGFAVAHAVDPSAPSPSPQPGEQDVAFASDIAETLLQAERPMIISGVSCGHPDILQAAANIARALKKQNKAAGLCYAVPEANSVGVAMMSASNLSDAVTDAGSAHTLVILENDLTRRLPPGEFAKLMQVENVIVLDYLENPTTNAAAVVLPATPFAETDGTFVNNEGRAQRFYKVKLPREQARESWKWLQAIGSSNGNASTPLSDRGASSRPGGISDRDASSRPGGIGDRAADMNWSTFTELVDATTAHLPVFSALGQIVAKEALAYKMPRQLHRYSGRTAMLANVDVNEPQSPPDLDSPLSFSMEGYHVKTESPLIDEYWAPGWNSAQALSRFQEEVSGPLRGGDPGVGLFQAAGTTAPYFTPAPEVVRESGKWLLLPIYHIFGSEELSIHSPGINELAPKPYALLHADDAAALGLHEGDLVSIESVPAPLPVKIQTAVKGVVGLPAGVPSMPGVEFFTQKNVRRGEF